MVCWGLEELSFELFPDRGVEALLALYRFKPCWTAPVVLTKLSEMPQEGEWAVDCIEVATVPMVRCNSVISINPVAGMSYVSLPETGDRKFLSI